MSHQESVLEQTSIEQLFKYYDKNNSGAIEIHELKHIMSDLGLLAGRNSTEASSLVLSAFSTADTDRDGSLNLTEFEAYYKKATAPRLIDFLKGDHPQEYAALRRAFYDWATFGIGSAHHQKPMTTLLLGSAHWIKLCKDTGIVPGLVSSIHADLIYAKVKSRGHPRITFIQFLDALGILATESGIDLMEVIEMITQSEGPVINGTTVSVIGKNQDESQGNTRHRHHHPKKTHLSSDNNNDNNYYKHKDACLRRSVDAEVMQRMRKMMHTNNNNQDDDDDTAVSFTWQKPRRRVSADAVMMSTPSSASSMSRRQSFKTYQSKQRHAYETEGKEFSDDEFLIAASRHLHLNTTNSNSSRSRSRSSRIQQHTKPPSSLSPLLPSQRHLGMDTDGDIMTSPLSPKPSTTIELVLERFQQFAGFGAGGNINKSSSMDAQLSPLNMTMDSKQFLKLCKDSDLVHSQASAVAVDLCFAKAKPKTARKLGFADFLVALALLAQEYNLSEGDVLSRVAACTGPRRNSSTAPTFCRLHDDKTTFTGVYKHGGPKPENFLPDLAHLLSREAGRTIS